MSNHGLRGHETVIRLVGKRRKLTSSAISPKKTMCDEVQFTSLVTRGDKNGNGLNVGIQSTSSKSITDCEHVCLSTSIDATSRLALEQDVVNIQLDGAREEKQVSCINWVQCPICEKSIRGDLINGHLDCCLQGAKGIKGKSKQLTMSHFRGSHCTVKPPTACTSAGFQRTTVDEKQRSFGFVKLEPVLTFRPPQPIVLSSQGRDTCETRMKEKSSGVKVVKVEDTGTVGTSQPVVLTSPEVDTRHTRMKLRRETGKGVQNNVDDCFKRTPELGLGPGMECTGTVDATALEVSRTAYIGSEEPGLDRRGYGKDLRSVNDLGGAMCWEVVDSDCSCHCHLPSSSVDSMGNCGAKVEDQVVKEEKLASSRDVVGGLRRMDQDPECGNPSNVRSSDKVTKDKYIGVLVTKIVGRRFNRGTTCKEGMKVTVLRDPDNPKDPNAIKIVLDESCDGPALGHLAREISLHLSGLLDKGLLQVSGFVTAVPEQIFGAVPIELHFESKMSKAGFLSLDGAEESFSKMLLAAEELYSFRPSSSGSASNYQQNFLFMLQTVLERDSHLFKDTERTFLESFTVMSDDAQRLFLRLYQRKGPWFRLSTVDYKDVADVGLASEELLGAAFMTVADNADEDPQAALRKRVEILNVLELRQLVCTALLKKKSEAAAAKKDDLVNMLVTMGLQKHVNLMAESVGQSGSTLVQMLKEFPGRCIRVSDTADFLLWRLQRLFFLNGDSDLSAFLLADMGLVKYPRFRCWRSRKIFETREALLAYEQALEVAQGMDMALECNDTKTALKLLEKARDGLCLDDLSQAADDRSRTFLARFSASYVYKNVCTLGVSILERERRYSEAVEVLRQLLSSKTRKSGRWGYWTVRLSMDLDHLGQKEESLQVAEEGVNDSWIRGGDRVALQRRVVRLGKPPRRWKRPPYAEALKRNCKEVQIRGRPLNCVTGMKSRFYGYDGEQCGVEELALQYYSSEEGGRWKGVHCEGGVWMTFFGLLMWDVLFADVPDVFQTSFQTAPLDLDTEVFFSSRQSLIEGRLALIAQGDAMKLLHRTWNENFGSRCRGVNWELHSLEELQTIASCIGGPGLSAVCRLLAEDHASWTAGMPDLLLWRTPTNNDSGHLLNVRTASSLCTKCGCSLIDKVFLPTGAQDPCTMLCSSQGEESEELPGGSKDALKSITSPPTRVGDCTRQGEAKLVEVKGPRDHLSEQQRAWIWILMDAGLNVEVCKVLEELA